MNPSTSPAAGYISSNFTWIDWAILAGVFVLTTVFGAVLAGKQSTFRQFFLAGRKLPWPAVAASIVSTQISAVSFVSLPFLVFGVGGNFTWLQIPVFGALISRFLVAWWLIPKFFEREIYSPYDYMANRLGGGVRSMTTSFFILTALLGNGARLYLTALVLELLLQQPLAQFEALTGITSIATSIWIIGIFSILWTILGGISSVVWTDTLMCVVMVAGALASLIAVTHLLPGGFGEMLSVTADAGRFKFWNFDTDPTKLYTFWIACIGVGLGGIESVGLDQSVAQRVLCCRNAAAARKAIIFSWIGIAIPILCLFVGAAIFAYYQRFPLTGTALESYTAKPDRIFPIFILTVLPTGLIGLLIAAIFAAAPTTSVLSALSQTTMSAFFLRRPTPAPAHGESTVATAEDRSAVRLSRLLIALYGIAMSAVAMLAEIGREYYPTLLDLIYSMSGYAGGALLGGFFLAWLPLNINARGYFFSAPLSVLVIVGLAWHQSWAQFLCAAGGSVIAIFWVFLHIKRGTLSSSLPQTVLLILAAVSPVLISRYAYFDNPAKPGAALSVAYFWYTLIGAIFTFGFGYLLAARKESLESPDSPRQPIATPGVST